MQHVSSFTKNQLKNNSRVRRNHIPYSLQRIIGICYDRHDLSQPLLGNSQLFVQEGGKELAEETQVRSPCESAISDLLRGGLFGLSKALLEVRSGFDFDL